MAKNKNQHFVPQLYLRNFAQTNRRQIALFHLKSRLHVFGASLRHQCARDHYYGVDDAIDGTLRKMEHRASYAIASAIRNTTPPAKGSDAQNDLLEFALVQRARTPAAAAVSETMFAHMRRHAPAMSPDPRDRARARLELSLQLSGHGLSLMSDLVLKVIFNTSDIEFVTSDAPVVFHNALCQDIQFRGTLGYSCAGLIVLLPLSPRHMILFFDASVYRVGDRKQRVIRLSDNSVVENLNAQQLNVALESLYYSGSPATQAAIDRMPFVLHQPRHELTTSVVAREEGGRSDLVHLFERPPTVKLDVSFIEVKRYYKRLSATERSRLTRPHADVVMATQSSVWHSPDIAGPTTPRRFHSLGPPLTGSLKTQYGSRPNSDE